MSTRIRHITKVGKGSYVTSSWNIKDYAIASFIYYITIFPVYLILKYCLYVPIKWGINKIISIKKTKEEN